MAASDSSFGPQWLTSFDFTLSFENWFFTIAPAAVIIAMTPFYVRRYLRQTAVCRFDALFWAKLLSSSALLVVNVALAIVWSRSPDFPNSSIPAVCLACIGALCIGIVILLSHRYSLRPSSLLSIYLTITFVVSIAKPRSFLLRDGSLRAVGALAVVDTVIRLVLVALEEFPKAIVLENGEDAKDFCKESTGGFWNRTLLIWALPTLMRGFRRSLKMRDLMTIGPEYSSKVLSNRFEVIWQKANKAKKHCLLKATLLTLSYECLVPIIPRLAWIAFNFTTPWFMRRVLSYIRNRKAGDAEQGGGLIGAAVLLYVGFLVAKTCTKHLTILAQTKMRGLIVSRIVRKVLVLKHSAAQDSASISLMSTDIEGIVESTSQIYALATAPIEIAIALYLLSTQVGHAFFLPIVTVIVLVVSSHILALRLRATSGVMNQSVQVRVAKTSEALTQLKAIRINGLERVVSKYLQSLRITEIKRSNAVRKVIVVMTALVPVHFALTPTFVVAGALFWTTWKEGLDPVTLFPTLALVTLLAMPLANILMTWPFLGGMVAYFKRIEDFLLLPERADPRVFQDHGSPSLLPVSEKNAVLQHSTSGSQDDEKQSSLEVEVPNDIAIALRGVSVAADEGAEAVLQNIDLLIKRFGLTMVVGPVGCGKSFLLRTMLGETVLLEGSIVVDKGNIAFCDQKLWLPNGTIQEAVVGESSFDASWYRRVTAACLLNEDIEQLPKKDQSKIGSNGALLSGGQKQRVAMARTLYAREPIVLLDDVFSALDRKTARTIFANLFHEDGILGKNSRTTTILATHSIEFLNNADEVAVFDAQKNLVTQATDATIQQLKSRGLLVEDEGQADASDKDEDITKQIAAIEAAEEAEEEDDDKVYMGGADLSLYRFFLGPAPKLLMVLFFILIAMASMFDSIIPLFMRAWTEVAPTDKYWFIGLACLAFGAMGLSGMTAGVFQLWIMPFIALSFHEQFLNTIMNAKLTFLTSTNNGELLNRASQDMSLVSQTLPKTFFLTVYGSFCVLGTTIVILSATTYAIVVIPFIVLVVYILASFYLRTSRQMRLLDLEAKTPLFTVMTESIAGLEHLRAFGWQEKTLEESLELLDYSQKSMFYMMTIQRWLLLILDSTVTIVAIALVIFATFWTHTATESSIGVGLLGLMDWNENLANWVNYYTNMETSLGAAQRMRTFIAETPVEKDKTTEDVPNWPTEGNIVFTNVTARYNTEDGGKALDDVSVSALAGQKIGITGRTGSGKSSFILTLLNMVDYTGQVTIDGVEISDIPRHQLRRAMTTISQDTASLAGTVRDNMFPREIDVDEQKLKEYDDEMKSILVKVELWDKISDKGGLDAILADFEFSQGQKQLFSLARAMMHKSATNSKIILIDEATSNVDHESDARIQTVMNEAFQGCTRLIIAHRLQTIQDADTVLEFSKGQLINVVDKQTKESKE